MRKKIWRMSEDQFDRENPILEFSVKKAEVSGYSGEEITGEFFFASVNQVPVRGMIFSSNPYVICQTPQFEGVKIRVRYKVSSMSLCGEDRLEGSFTILYNGGECSIPYVIHFLQKYPRSSQGEIRTMEDFALLAKKQWAEALQLFFSEDFAAFMSRQKTELRLLFQGYRRALPVSRNLEEFLIAAGCKERVSFDVREETREFYEVSENLKETVEITKSSWGYVSVDVSCDNDFITVEKEHVTSDFFLGNRMELNFYIHKDRLHAGKNYAAITFEDGEIRRQIVIIASKGKKEEHVCSLERLFRKRVLTLMRRYEQFSLGQLSAEDWCSETVLGLDQMKQEIQLEEWVPQIRREEQINWCLLVQAYALLMNQRRQEGLWIIQKLKREITDKKSVSWAFLLYLCTMIEEDENYINRLTNEIEVISREHPKNLFVFCFLLSVHRDYAKSSTKLKSIGQWIDSGWNTPILYAQAYDLIRENPFLLRSFSGFFMKVLMWAKKHHALTEDVVMQVMRVLSGEKRFSFRVFELLEEGYQVWPQEEFLTALIGYLLKNHKYGSRYLSWYRQAIAREISMTGLYEGYLSSIPENSVEKMPEIVIRYFQYNSNVAYQKKALLYANIIVNRKSQPDDYDQYERTIASFAAEQIGLGHMDDNLAIIYQDVLKKGELTPEIGKAMSELLFMKKVICLVPGISRVFLYQEQYQMPQVAAVSDFCAYIPVVSRKYSMFLEHEKGYLIADGQKYVTEELMTPQTLIKSLRETSDYSLNYMLYHFRNKKLPEDFLAEDMIGIDRLIHAKEVRDDYKVLMYPAILGFLQEYDKEDLIEKHFLEEVDFFSLPQSTLTLLLEWLAERGHGQRIYRILQRLNGLHLSDSCLLSLCEEMISWEEPEGDDFLISLCAWLLDKNVCSAVTCAYLIRYYMGPARLMIRLWRKAESFHLPSKELKERILIQMLYGELEEPEIFDVFESYVSEGPNRMIAEAFYAYFTHDYLLKNRMIPDRIFSHIARAYRQGESLNESCRIAFMKYMCGKKQLEAGEADLLEELLRQSVQKGIFFAFYRKLSPELLIRYHLYDREFVEYHGMPGETLEIFWERNGKNHKEELLEMYEGIYVKPLVLFDGEEIPYRICRSKQPDEPLVSGILKKADPMPDDEPAGRYGYLNHLRHMAQTEREDELLAGMKEYQCLDEITQVLFDIR